MSFDLSETKRKARQALHGLAGVLAYYTGPALDAPTVELFVRWHNKTARPVGDLENGGYAEIISGIDRLVFSQENLDAPLQSDGTTAAPVTLQRTGVVEFRQYDIAFSLEAQEPGDGPLNVYWTVLRE